MLDPKSCEAPLADALQSLSPPGAVAWALTRNKEFAELADRNPSKCFRDNRVVFAEMYVQEPYYFDSVEAACARLNDEIAAGKIKTNHSDWRPTKNEDWLANRSVQIDFGNLQSVFPVDGRRFFSSKFVCLPGLFDHDHLTLTIAALWIATQGGLVECNVADVEVWKLAFEALFKKIREDLIDLIGKRWGKGDPVKISGCVLLNIAIDYPIDYRYLEESDLIFSERYLRCDGIGSSNDLISEWQLAWGDLQVKRAQLLEHWPFRRGSSQDFYLLPEEPPRQAAAAYAYKLLSLKYRDRNVPRLSKEQLARQLTAANPDRNARPINADAVKRALGLKK
jgi:hypothetical protein